MSEEKSEEKKFDIFELVVACVLGLGALGGAWAGYQGGLWGGNQSTSYGEAANKMSESSAIVTEASRTFNLAIQVATRDLDLDLQAKRAFVEAEFSKDEGEKELKKIITKYMYTQMSEEAYAYLGLPKVGPTAEAFMSIPDAAIAKAVENDLGEKYMNQLLAPSQEHFAEAAKKAAESEKAFYDGRQHNYKGDRFSLTGVLYTVCLFLAGIALVFKSRVKWAFGLMALAGLIVSTIHLFSTEWTSSGPPEPPPGMAAASASPSEPVASAAASSAPAPSAAPAGSVPKSE